METIRLNLVPVGATPICHTAQYDEGRQIKLELYNGAAAYQIQAGDTFALNLKKPDGHIVEAAITGTQGNTYLILETTEQMCAVPGINICKIKVKNGDDEIGTLIFNMSVQMDVLSDGDPSQSLIEDIDAIVAEAIGNDYYDKDAVDSKLDLKEDKSSFTNVKNLFDYTTVTDDYFLRHDTGNIQSVAGWSVSDYIPVSGLTKFATCYGKHFAYYNSSKTFIPGSGFEVTDAAVNVISVPAGAAYVRFDWNVAKLNYFGYAVSDIQVIPNAINIDSSFHTYNTPYNFAFNGEEKYLDYWAGKRILWLGTSIPEGNRRPAYGYPNILAEKLGCTVINNAVGGSMAMSGRQMLVSESDPYGLTGQSWGWTKGLTQPLSLKNDFITNWSTWKTKFTGAPDTLDDTVQSMILASSYENALDPYLTNSEKCDLYVLNFGWNESTPELYSKDSNNRPYCDWTYQYKADDAADINTVDPYRYNTKTFRGAYNWIIRRILSAQPQAAILIIGEGEAAAHVNLVTAQEKCAYENACQYIPLWKIMGLNQRKVSTSKRTNSGGWWENTAFTGAVQYCRIYDGTHPQGTMTNKIADYLEAQFRFNIRA